MVAPFAGPALFRRPGNSDTPSPAIPRIGRAEKNGQNPGACGTSRRIGTKPSKDSQNEEEGEEGGKQKTDEERERKDEGRERRLEPIWPR